MHLSKYLLGLAIALLAYSAVAANVSGSERSGYRGGPVTATLNDSDAGGFNSLGLNVSFDPLYLIFEGPKTGGNATSSFTFFDPDPAPGGLKIHSILFDVLVVDDTDIDSGNLVLLFSTSNQPAPPGSVGDLASLFFTIKDNAPFDTTLVFFTCTEYFDNSNPPKSVGCFDYAFLTESAKITVLEPDPNTVPNPGTLPLVFLGFAGIAALRKKM